MKRTLTVALFALALLVGPVAAACGSCCPESTPETTLASPAGCCGDCEPTVERSPDPASLTSKSTVAPADGHAILLAPAAHPLPVETTSRVAGRGANRVSPSLILPAPLRL